MMLSSFSICYILDLRVEKENYMIVGRAGMRTEGEVNYRI
jgi:hypothetical protein